MNMVIIYGKQKGWALPSYFLKSNFEFELKIVGHLVQLVGMPYCPYIQL